MTTALNRRQFVQAAGAACASAVASPALAAQGPAGTLFCAIGLLDEDFVHQTGRYVGVRDGRIAYIGDCEPSDAASYGERYDGRGKLLMPALYNAHAHAPMTLLRGYAENLALQDWLNTKVFPFEACIDDAAAGPATELAIAEMLRFGCAGFSDMYFFDDARCEAVLASGIKCNVARSIAAFDAPSYRELPEAQANAHLLEAWDGAGDGRIKVDLCVHAEYTNGPAVCRGLAEEALEHGSIVQVHVSETRREVEECRARHGGLSPVRFLEECGIFDNPVVAAHCVWVDEDDIAVLAGHGATVACNPASNLKLASGFAPVPAMLAAGVNVALGTDGPASDNAHNLFRDAYLFATLYKGATGDPTAVTPRQALYAATRAGALAQGRYDCGSVAVGNRADLAVLDVDVPWMHPATDVAANVVYAASGAEVVLTMVDGRVLYRDGEWPTVDVERAQREVDAATERIVKML